MRIIIHGVGAIGGTVAAALHLEGREVIGIARGAGAPSNRINVGCIGTGNMGFSDLQGLMHQDDTQIVAVCDQEPALAGGVEQVAGTTDALHAR